MSTFSLGHHIYSLVFNTHLQWWLSRSHMSSSNLSSEIQICIYNKNTWMSHKHFRLDKFKPECLMLFLKLIPLSLLLFSLSPSCLYQKPGCHSWLNPSSLPYPHTHLSSAIDLPKTIFQVPAQAITMAELDYSNNFLTGHLHFTLILLSIPYIVSVLFKE